MMLLYELRKRTAQRTERMERDRAQHSALREQNKPSHYGNFSCNLIQHYNEHHDLHKMLLAYGWIPKGRHLYASPFSQSKGASVQVYGQRAVSYTQSDHGNIGKVTDNGYSMQTRSHLEKFVFLVGNGANGKSVALNVLICLLGAANIAAVHPSRLANVFDRAELDQKFANIVSESEHGLKLPAAELKALISGESMTVSRKHQQPFTLNPFATFFWATNHLPSPSDFSDALYRRTFILEFNHQFNGERRDVNLFDKLKRERDGILNMCLEAYGCAQSGGG